MPGSKSTAVSDYALLSFGTRTILLQKSVLTNLGKFLALLRRAARFDLRAYARTLITRRRASNRIYKQDLDGIFN
jgi:hypothetical protein